MGVSHRTLASALAFLAIACFTAQARGERESVKPTLQARIHQAAVRTIPCIAQVEVAQVLQQYPQQPGLGEYRKSGLGSGILIGRSGTTIYLLTNNHVLDEADEITVRLYNGDTYPAQIAGRDVRRDLAVVRFQAARKLKMARLGDSSQVQVGDWVMAVGSPLGLESSVTLGIVSAVGRRGGPGGNISDFIQTDAVINPGNSGGALVNLDGELVGINTWIASQSGQYEGFGFAIPVNAAKRSIRYLLAGGNAVYAWLGVGCADPPAGLRSKLGLPAKGGSLVLNIYLGSPADKAGLRPGDFLERIDGRMLQGTEDLIQSIADGEPGRAASIRIVRDGVHIDIKAVLGQRLPDRQLAAMNNRFWPGWIAGDAQSEEKWEGGAELVEVVRDSPADQADFRAGDLIVAVNGAPVADAYSLLKALDRSGAARRIAFLRGNTRMERELPAAAEDSKP